MVLEHIQNALWLHLQICISEWTIGLGRGLHSPSALLVKCGIYQIRTMSENMQKKNACCNFTHSTASNLKMSSNISSMVQNPKIFNFQLEKQGEKPYILNFTITTYYFCLKND